MTELRNPNELRLFFIISTSKNFLLSQNKSINRIELNFFSLMRYFRGILSTFPHVYSFEADRQPQIRVHNLMAVLIVKLCICYLILWITEGGVFENIT